MARPTRATPKPRLMLQIEEEDQETLKQIAHSLGFLIPSGKHAGQGSISALVAAIAQGKLVLEKVEESMPKPLDFLNQLKAAMTLGETLEALKPLLEELHYHRLKDCLAHRQKPAIATNDEIKFISARFWKIFDGDINVMTAMNDIRQDLALFGVNDDGTLFDKSVKA